MINPADFDPYQRWLGITTPQRPPTHYQLLGISPTLTDHREIEMAAVRQSTMVRACQSTDLASIGSRVLAEIAEARTTLIDPVRRKRYDMQLAGHVPKPAAPAPTPAIIVKKPSPSQVGPKVEVIATTDPTPPKKLSPSQPGIKVEVVPPVEVVATSKRTNYSQPGLKVELVPEIEEAPKKKPTVTVEIAPKKPGLKYSEPMMDLAHDDDEAEVVEVERPRRPAPPPRKSRAHAEDSESEPEDSGIVKIAVVIGAVVVIGIVGFWGYHSFTSPPKQQADAGTAPLFTEAEMNKKANDPDPPRKVIIPDPKKNDRGNSSGKPSNSGPRITAQREQIDFEKSEEDIRVQSIDTKIDPHDVGQAHLIAKQARLSRMEYVRPKDMIESEVVVDEALIILSDSKHDLIEDALGALTFCIPNRRLAEMEERTLPYLQQKEHAKLAAAALIHWESNAAFSTIQSLVTASDYDVANAILRAVGESRDPKFLELLANAFRVEATRDAAARAFREYGESAETIMIELIKNADGALFADGCEVLKIIGDSKSYDMLKARSGAGSTNEAKIAANALTFLDKAMDARKAKKKLEEDKDS